MTELSRRRLLQITGAAGLTGLLPIRFGGMAWAQPTVGSLDPERDRGPAVPAADPAHGMPMTTVWSYGSVNHPAPSTTPRSPSRRGPQARSGQVDQRSGGLQRQLPAAPPAGGPDAALGQPAGWRRGSRRSRRRSRDTRPYTGPVPIVTHLHGGHNAQESDGYAEAWYLPAAKTSLRASPAEGTFYDFFRAKSRESSA